MLKQNHLLYAPAGEGSAGAGGGEGSAAEGGSQTPNEVETLRSEIEKLRNHNSTLLGEVKTTKQKLKEIEDAKTSAQEEEAQKSQNFKQLFEITKEKLSKLENDVKERENREAELQKKVLKTKQEEAFKKELGSELVSDEFLKLVNWEKVVVDPTITDKIEFNRDGLSQAVEEFKTKFGTSVLKTSTEATQTTTKMGQAAKGGKVANPSNSFAERAKKAGLV